MERQYEILKEGRNNKVLVKWYRNTRVEYSVHTWDLNKEGLIWGHYFDFLSEAEEYFAIAQNM